MGEPGRGLNTALETALANSDDAPPRDDGEQLDMLEDYLGLSARDDGKPAAAIGRPKGAQNKRTREWAEFLLQRYGSPMEILMQVARAPVDDLRSRVGCTRLEALQEKCKAAVALLPYMHSRQPIAVDVTDRRTVYFNVDIATDDQPSSDDDSGTVIIDAELPPTRA